MTISVLYHANCYDGFGAAWAAWKKLGNTGVRYVPVSYGSPPPEELVNRIERLGPEGEPLGDPGPVYLLDFSYPRAVLATFAAAHVRTAVPGEIEFETFNGIILDHHKTAEADLAGLAFATFDLKKSGAVLAWEHFHPGEPIPPMLRYIQDRDLWKFDLPGSREISQYMRSWPFDFDTWNEIERNLRFAFESCRTEGEGMLRFQIQQVKLMADRVEWVTLAGHRVPCVNATVFFSEVGEELCIRHPESPFSAYYLDWPDRRQWGLRSRNGFDCSAVAKHYGGGGHPGAAGFTTKRNWSGDT